MHHPMHLKLKDISITLPHKPTATLRISALFPGTSSPDFADSSSPDIAALPPSSTLLVFLNGLILPRSSWTECISRFLRIRGDSHRLGRSSSTSSASSSSDPGFKAAEPTSRFESAPVPCGSGSASDNGIHPHLTLQPRRENEYEYEIPNILTYDRYGQGSSDPDPSDPSDPDNDTDNDTTPYGHTPVDVITDLHQLLLLVSRQFLPLCRDLKDLDVVMVANSIGCPLARLFNDARFPSSSVRVVGYLFLDSMMANSDFVDSVFPDPDAEGFVRERDLKEGVSEEDLRWTRKMFRQKFHPSVGNAERLDRRGLRALLPWSDRPKLTVPARGDGRDGMDGKDGKEQEQGEGDGGGEGEGEGHGRNDRKTEKLGVPEGHEVEEGPGGEHEGGEGGELEKTMARNKTKESTTTEHTQITRPKVIVIGHDWDVFADQNEKGPMSIPKAVINGYMNPAWQRYNEGLTRLAAGDGDGDDDNNVVPVKIAKGCGHFIQKDDPELVAREVDLLLRRLGL
ncbi:hypothetical protein QBC32DRAFT_390601 [Pseudoneurospora amorphoporcata]|uniref:AB hydrolase-1 domain-containing protein n=1 Tax=Pseudoneurospora amorphoporcata TaxID=241081 RepID=A0AAN6NUD4_9PEZI|nr:hypothetical protein QBC32DRAFT_390601 [Pseudoneurospora amorphoporcata]